MTKRSYDQQCPVARTLDLVGERWTLLIIRDLLRGSRRYTDLRNGLPGMASNLLAMRLHALEEAGLIERVTLDDPSRHHAYRLTSRGTELEAVITELARFGLPYLGDSFDSRALPPEQMPEAIRALVLTEELTPAAVTVRLDLDVGDYTLLAEPAGAPGRRRRPIDRISVRVTNTRREAPPVTIAGAFPTLLAIRRGDLPPRRAIEDGLVELRGRDPSLLTVGRMFGFDRSRAT